MTEISARRPRRRKRLIASATAAVAALAFAPAVASAGVTLDWTAANVYDSASPRDTNRTWFGYTTSSQLRANGTISASNGATGPVLTPDSPRGPNELATYRYAATEGAINERTLTGSMTFAGTVSFVSPAPPAGHGFTITVENPRLVLNGTSGEIYASGTSSTGSYDASQALFDLDLTNAGFMLAADGTRTLTGAVAALASEGTAFPGNYRVGAGPDRTPNTFGTFELSVSPNTGPRGADGAAGAKGDKGDKGDAGPKGDKGDRGERGARGPKAVIRVQSSTLRAAPFKAKKAVKVRVLARKGKKVLATGAVRGRTLTVTLAPKVKAKRLKGVYRLRAVKNAKRVATVRIP